MSGSQHDEGSPHRDQGSESSMGHAAVASGSSTTAACATDDADFDRIMARFDDLAEQEAAFNASSATGWLFSDN